MLAIVDYGAGNLQSVKKALDFIGVPAEITADAGTIRRAAGVILPGVGAFGDVMQSMHKRGLVDLVRAAADGSRPFLGICLGQQLLFASSEESPGVTGLSVLPGQVLRIPGGEGRKVPHMGWNSLHLLRRDGIFAGVPEDAYVYFVHSFYVKAADEGCVAARTQYGVAIDAAVCNGLMTATQFHPEKSGDVGLVMLRNFTRLCG
jgi:glutamine amidotransferase